VWSDEDLAAAGPSELHIEFGRWHGSVRDCGEAVGGAVRAAEYAKDARQGASRARVDAEDSRVGVRRANHHRIGLLFHVEIVAVPALADQKTKILLAAERLSACA